MQRVGAGRQGSSRSPPRDRAAEPAHARPYSLYDSIRAAGAPAAHETRSRHDSGGAGCAQSRSPGRRAPGAGRWAGTHRENGDEYVRRGAPIAPGCASGGASGGTNGGGTGPPRWWWRSSGKSRSGTESRETPRRIGKARAGGVASARPESEATRRSSGDSGAREAAVEASTGPAARGQQLKGSGPRTARVNGSKGESASEWLKGRERARPVV
jgi:hypothetical protein